MKKIISLILFSALVSTSVAPTIAIENITPDSNNTSTQSNVTTQKVKKIKKAKKKKETRIYKTENKYNYVNMAWWQGFNDENLNNYIIKAVENNKDLKVASLTIDEYYQNVKAQRADELPSVYTGFLPGYGKLMGSTSGSFALPILASYEVDLWGKNHNKTTSIRKVYETKILDEQAAYISIASAVGTTYINTVKLDALIDLQEQIVALRKEIFDIMDTANKEGIISTFDLVKANQAYITGVTELTDLKKNRTKALHQLAVLTGDSPNNIDEYTRTSYNKLKYSGVIPTTVNSDVIMQRPDYLKAEKMMEKAGIDVRIARKEMCPSITLGGGVLFNNKHFESLFTTSGMLWGIGGGLIQPAFMGGKLRANLKASKIRYEKSVKNYEQVNLTSMQEVNDALVTVNKDREKLTKQKEIQSLEKKDYSLSQAKFKEGVITKLDLDQMQENLLSVNKMVYSTEFDCMVNYISYYKAVAAHT